MVRFLAAFLVGLLAVLPTPNLPAQSPSQPKTYQVYTLESPESLRWVGAQVARLEAGRTIPIEPGVDLEKLPFRTLVDWTEGFYRCSLWMEGRELAVRGSAFDLLIDLQYGSASMFLPGCLPLNEEWGPDLRTGCSRWNRVNCGAQEPIDSTLTKMWLRTDGSPHVIASTTTEGALRRVDILSPSGDPLRSFFSLPWGAPSTGATLPLGESAVLQVVWEERSRARVAFLSIDCEDPPLVAGFSLKGLVTTSIVEGGHPLEVHDHRVEPSVYYSVDSFSAIRLSVVDAIRGGR